MEMSTLNSNNPEDKEQTNLVDVKRKNNMADHSKKNHLAIKPMVKVLAFFTAIGGFLFGYDTGVVSGAMIQLRTTFNLSTLWQELIVSVTIGAAAVASLGGAFLNDWLGRRPVMLIASFVFSVGAVVLAASPVKEVLLIGRLIVGLGVGLAAMTVPMFIAEVAPPHARGMLVTLNNVFITGGQVTASVVDGAFSYFDWGWRAMLGLAAVPAVIQLIGFLFLPESPRWLITHGHIEKARQVLRQVVEENEVEVEFEKIQKAEQEQTMLQHESKGSSVFLRVLGDASVRRALMVGCGLQLIQQLAGINTVMYYSGTIIRMSGVQSDNTVIWLAAAVASVNFFGTLIGLYLVGKINRRTLTLGSLGLVAIVLVFMAACFFVIADSSPSVGFINPNAGSCAEYRSCDSCILEEHCGFCYEEFNGTYVNSSGSCLPVDTKHVSYSLVGMCSEQNHTSDTVWGYDFCPTPYGYLALIGMALYLLAFAPGMGPMPWTINSEIYPMWARSFGNGCATATNWVCNLIISMTFLSLTETITRYGTFMVYAGICVLGFIFLFAFLPETKDRHLEEVIDLFAQPVCSCSGRKTVKYQRIQIIDPDDQGNSLPT